MVDGGDVGRIIIIILSAPNSYVHIGLGAGSELGGLLIRITVYSSELARQAWMLAARGIFENTYWTSICIQSYLQYQYPLLLHRQGTRYTDELQDCRWLGTFGVVEHA